MIPSKQQLNKVHTMTIEVIKEFHTCVNRETQRLERITIEYTLIDGVFYLLEEGLDMEDQSFESYEDLMFIIIRSLEDSGYDIV